jgi:hypothetical protein
MQHDGTSGRLRGVPVSYEHDSDDYPEDYRGDPEPEDARLSEEEAERWPYLASLGEEPDDDDIGEDRPE